MSLQKENIKSDTQKLFYDEETLILDEYRHLETPQYIVDSLWDFERNDYGESWGEEWKRGHTIGLVEFSLKYRNQEGTKCQKPIFVNRYRNREGPLFLSHSQEKLNWYLYWRTSFLRGEILETDNDYIELFIDELLNYSFNQRASFNISVMSRLIEAYGEKKFRIRLFNDLLTEVGATELIQSEKRLLDCLKVTFVYRALLECNNRKKSKNKNEKRKSFEHHNLSDISIDGWEPYCNNKIKTHFFKEKRSNSYKINQIFKNCLFLLEEEYNKNESSLLNEFYEIKITKRNYSLYPGRAVYRKDLSSLDHLIEVDVVYTTEKIIPVMTAYYLLSENIARIILGETEQLSIEEGVLPKNLKEKMLEFMDGKEKSKRKSHTKKVREPQSEVIVEFNDERIKKIQVETDYLVEEVDKRASDYEEIELPVKEEIIVPQIGEKSSGLENFFMKSNDEIDAEQINEFINELDEIETNFLKQFSPFTLTKQEAIQHLKKKGRMAGSTIDAINEKAQEILEDNLLEEEGEQYLIFEEFEELIIRMKGTA